jgi:glycosyltransferase involved in cell wall biosynthesis
MKPVFSIILPCWNSINFIEKCIDSIKKQTFQNFEVIVIDNSSHDGTLEKINQIKDKRFKIYSINNEGILARSRNLGIKKSNGEWIAFLDSDDWWTEDKLEVCFKYTINEVDFIYHDLEIKSSQTQYFRRRKNKSRQLKKPVLIDLLVNGNAISNSSAVVRKKFLDKIGGIDENKDLPAAEDFNAWLRIAKITDQFIYLPYKLGYYFIHNQGMSHKDMSIPSRHAVYEFLKILNKTQKLKLESNLKYQSGRFNYLQSNFKKAKKDLLFVFQKGNYALKIRAFIMITSMIFKSKK